MKRSTILAFKSGKSEGSKIRTSYGTYFRKKQPSLIAEIEKCCQQWTGFPQSHGEFIQVMRYRKGGGATEFTDLGVKVYPKKGSAILFMNVDENNSVDASTLHAGLPVKSGEKWIATLWVRAQPFHPKKQ